MMFGGFGGGNMGPRGNEAGFGGIPPELQANVDRLTEHEPDPKPVDVDWVPSRRPWNRPLSFRMLFGLVKPAVAGIFVLIIFETLGQQMHNDFCSSIRCWRYSHPQRGHHPDLHRGVPQLRSPMALSLRAPVELAIETPQPAAPYVPQPSGRRSMFDPDRGETIEVEVYRRADLHPGAQIAGPALIVEDETSTVVSPAFDAAVDGYGYIELRRRES